MDASQHFCIECGSGLTAGLKYCTECGAAVERSPLPSPVEAESAPAPIAAAVQPSAQVVPKKSGVTKILSLVLIVVLFLGAVGGWAVWWFFIRDDAKFGNNTVAVTLGSPVSNPAATPSGDPNLNNLITGGTFEGGTDLQIEGEGQFANDPGNPGNRVWQITGDAEMGFSFPLPATNGSGPIQVSFLVLIPSKTQILSFDGQQMKGVRLRARLTDRYESSAVSDNILSPQDSWQTVRVDIEDTGSGPYKLTLEGIWFQGSIYFDDVEANVSAPPGVANSAPPVSRFPIPPSQPADEKADLESWFNELPWFVKFRNKMQKGVTLSVWVETGTAGNGWHSIEVREHHAPDSGFDPNVSPMVGMFRVSPDRNAIEFFDVVDGDYGSIQPFLKNWDLN